jgi:hypothetical protein
MRTVWNLLVAIWNWLVKALVSGARLVMRLVRRKPTPPTETPAAEEPSDQDR